MSTSRHIRARSAKTLHRSHFSRPRALFFLPLLPKPAIYFWTRPALVDSNQHSAIWVVFRFQDSIEELEQSLLPVCAIILFHHARYPSVHDQRYGEVLLL